VRRRMMRWRVERDGEAWLYDNQYKHGNAEGRKYYVR
jgi:hypothetical protein